MSGNSEHKSYNIKHLNTVQSTNNFLKTLRKEKKAKAGTVILADFQDSGRGQRENKWFSSPSKNLLCSIFLNPNLKIEEHFYITITTSLSICRLLNRYNFKPEIKWPNDIYLDNKKVAGILIENSIMGDQIKDTIIGIGLNVNQESFPYFLPFATSLIQQSGKETEITNLLHDLIDELDKCFNELRNEQHLSLFKEYKNILFRKDKKTSFIISEKEVSAIIRDVKSGGELILEMSDGSSQEFLFGELSFQLEAGN